MNEREKLSISPSRTYVALCWKTIRRETPDGNVSFPYAGHYLQKFTLPDREGFSNNAEFASWYFLTRVSATACIDLCLTFEDYQNIQEA